MVVTFENIEVTNYVCTYAAMLGQTLASFVLHRIDLQFLCMLVHASGMPFHHVCFTLHCVHAILQCIALQCAEL